LARPAPAAQVLHSISAHQLDLLRSMDAYMESTVVPILKDVGACWQPSDFLPDPASPDFLDEARWAACLPWLCMWQASGRSGGWEGGIAFGGHDKAWPGFWATPIQFALVFALMLVHASVALCASMGGD
jgi:hypothetical protein